MFLEIEKVVCKCVVLLEIDYILSLINHRSDNPTHRDQSWRLHICCWPDVWQNGNLHPSHTHTFPKSVAVCWTTNPKMSRKTRQHSGEKLPGNNIVGWSRCLLTLPRTYFHWLTKSTRKTRNLWNCGWKESLRKTAAVTSLQGTLVALVNNIIALFSPNAPSTLLIEEFVLSTENKYATIFPFPSRFPTQLFLNQLHIILGSAAYYTDFQNLYHICIRQIAKCQLHA